MSPTPTPAPPPYPPLDLAPVELTPGDRLADAIEHLNDFSPADLDAMLSAADSGITFPLPLAPALSVTLDDWSVTIAATPLPASIGTALAALIGTALAIAIIVALHRVTSPEAQARRAAKRAALHDFYTERLHAEQAARRAAERLHAERLRDQERAAAAALLTEDKDEEPRP